MVAAVCGLTSASAGEFLDGLAARADRVDSSPYATGGDVILCLSEEKGDYVHIFTNTVGTAALLTSQTLYAQVLVVAGGGGGGAGYFAHGGGGGGGGVVDAGLVLEAGVETSVKVGGGGSRTIGNDQRRGGMGGNSQFGALTAMGGGGGGGFHSGTSGSSNDGLAGGSGGGGGGCQSFAGLGGACSTAGQGHAGGKGAASSFNDNGHSGGGGGAGAPGCDADAPRAISGDGGAGAVRYILGAAQPFAGGGGGGSMSANQPKGGMGGGGGGSFSGHVDADPGEDGLGGGGGGCACINNAYYSGRGGSGIVIVRYRVSNEPELKCMETWTAPNSDHSVSVSTMFFTAENAAAPTVTGLLECWPTEDESAKMTVSMGTQSATNLWTGGVFTYRAKGLAFATDYSYRVTLTNGGGATDLIEGTFTTLEASCGGTISGIEESDYIHKAAFDGSDEIFIFTNPKKSAVFTPQADGFIRLLLVGGGGAGFGMGKDGAVGGGGGGGGGGVIYNATYFVQAGQEYAISVGAGSEPRHDWFQSANGGNTTFGALVAYGGGAGGGDRVGGATGGSGGGGGHNNAGGMSLDGQGHAGGNSTGGMSGGGGGAGSAGGGPTGAQAGNGGDGATYDITGEIVTYAGGGGAGIGIGYTGGAGGVGGGGAGCSGTTPSQPGVDGLGGGGGGGNMGEGSKTQLASRGGNGIAVIRYTDASKLSDDPKFTALFANVGDTSVDVHIDVTYCGSGSDSVSLSAVWGYSADNLAYTNELVASFSGAGDFKISGLSPKRDYVMKIVASNAKGGRSEGNDFVFTTQSGLGAKTTITQMVYDYDFGYTVTALGTGANVAELCVGDQGAEEVVETVNVTETGSLAIHHVFPVSLDEQKLFYFIRIVNTEDGCSWTQETAVASFVMSDNSTFTFSAPGGIGGWFDPTTWSANHAGGIGYPGSLSKVLFPNKTYSEVQLDESMRVGSLALSGLTGATVVFKGLTDNVSIYNVTGAGDWIIGAGTTCIVDHAKIDFNSGGNWPKFSANQGFVLRNGASYSYDNGVEINHGNGGYLSVESGSTFSSTQLWGQPTVRVRVDDATLSTGAFLPTQSGGSGAMYLEISGANPSFRCSSASTGSGPVSMLFDPPEDPTAWTEAPFQSRGGFGGGSYTWTVNLPDKQTSKLRRTGKSRDIPLIYAASGITTNNVVFGTHPFRKGGFVYSDDLKTLYYRYVPGNGTVMFVR